MIDEEALQSIRSLAAERGATLVVATKTQSKETVEALHALAPEVIMGENRVQELVDKYDPAIEWHMIGRLQTNKVKYIVDKVSLIHSLDRPELAAEIEKQAAKRGKIQDALIEINMGGEESKGGVDPDGAEEFLNSLAQYAHLRITGIMSVMPRLDDEEALCGLYEKLRALFERLKSVRQTNAQMKYLSAGMSGDYKIALDYGANMLRIGRAILGERPRPVRDI